MSISDALQALLDEDLLDGPSAGIARRIIAVGALSQLTAKQRSVYEKHIQPHFDKVCEIQDCLFEIEMTDMADAIRDQAVGTSVYCGHCKYVAEANAKID